MVNSPSGNHYELRNALLLSTLRRNCIIFQGQLLAAGQRVVDNAQGSTTKEQPSPEVEWMC